MGKSNHVGLVMGWDEDAGPHQLQVIQILNNDRAGQGALKEKDKGRSQLSLIIKRQIQGWYEEVDQKYTERCPEEAAT
jgi:hypothetical protein